MKFKILMYSPLSIINLHPPISQVKRLMELHKQKMLEMEDERLRRVKLLEVRSWHFLM